MARREELLLHLWKDLINLNLREASHGQHREPLQAQSSRSLWRYSTLLMADPNGMEGRPGSAEAA
jgi:hypothetical protein